MSKSWIATVLIQLDIQISTSRSGSTWVGLVFFSAHLLEWTFHKVWVPLKKRKRKASIKFPNGWVLWTRLWMRFVSFTGFALNSKKSRIKRKKRHKVVSTAVISIPPEETGNRKQITLLFTLGFLWFIIFHEYIPLYYMWPWQTITTTNFVFNLQMKL